MTISLEKAVERFLESFLRGCEKAIFKNVSNFSSSRDWFFSIKSTAEVTLGAGTNASGSTSKQSVAFPTLCAKTERDENSFCLDSAENLTATSFWTITKTLWQCSSLNAFKMILVAI